MTMSTPVLSPRLREHPSQSRTHKSRPSASRTPAAAPPLTPRRLNEGKATSLVLHDPRTPSPNYFGLAVDANADCFSSSAAQHLRGNWSPPSSNVRSIAATSPRVIPADQNLEFDQFRRQSGNSKAFALGNLLDFGARPATSAAPTGPVFGYAKLPSPNSTVPSTNSIDYSNRTKSDGSEGLIKPRSPKRLLSTESSLFPERPRRNSPASFLDRSDELAEFVEGRNLRPSLPAQPATHSFPVSHHRAETLPASLENESKTDGPVMTTPQHVVNILESAAEEVLLLDLRVSTQHAKSRIVGALSLCIPTTLLKRASFNVKKLAETFKEEDHREKFEGWRSSKYIIVYDASSSQMKDAATCINTLKKFTNEGWAGGSYIIRGGFSEFSEKFPSWIAHNSTNSPMSASLHLDSSLPSVAPVIGGCPMPATQNAANPFFGNIRQNMDLIGGVGQLSLKHPATMTNQIEEDLPSWLRHAVNEMDNGRLVSDKFLQIEKREQKRMQEALSSKVVFGSPATGSESTRSVQIAGIEKGSKNRYNSIWPYEHTRVKLEGVADGGCDYVNANYVQTARSNKRYIATQGPLPATFNDFWNVVWQQDVRVIVMLTAEQEGGQVKAHNYWCNKQYGHMQLNALGERRASLEPLRIHRHRDRPALGQRRATNPPKPANLSREPNNSSPNSDQPYVIVRKFTLSNSNEPFQRMREITQLQYSSWPDFGAPAHPAHLLGLIEQCDAVVRQVNGGHPSRPDPPNGRPVLVHCSAGCGRTGTFCTVDSVIDMLKRQRQARNLRQGTSMEMEPLPGSSSQSRSQESPFFKDEKVEGNWAVSDDLDLIEQTVEEFRLQRLSMVQSLRQFVLCYESVLEWLVEQHPKSA
ncbi:tyrosine-protein phosphatase non-receptor type 6 [Lindgomyces ingoldianus]|uniref:Tyrosine-protein phosphatase non-receptor type 6 n=1 Tax=Lindgomyces ingoldianus TaxID=673940 RepID=A0ACB6R1R6_9PLEO|nr:tyrosine-protein phosphatase non-receptor type 6 [Lindgomyces ingoldianus]KAF2473040.1 tyrosine-protein phosphatase non-receptor type 6 [Lindgomyces ingoldianus]